MSDPQGTQVDAAVVEPAPPKPVEPTPAPAPAPEPQPDAAPESDFDRLDREGVEQYAGAQKALLASSLSAAVESAPEKQSKVVALADKLGLSPDVVAQNYDQLNRRVQLQALDYNRLLQHHPEVADWLKLPANSSIAHEDVPVLQQLDAAFRTLTGEHANTEPTGILPYGYMFKADGTIRGPLHVDGTEPIVYKSLDAVRQKFQREEAQEGADQFINEAAADRLRDSWFPAIEAGVRSYTASTGSAILRATGGRWAFSGNDGGALAMYSEAISAGGHIVSPGIGGDLGQLAGGLIADAPLYLLGGEVAGIADAAASLRVVAAGAKTLAAPRSEYMLDAFKAALTYSPVAARSGINTGADEGAGYGITDFLINSAVPGAFGTKFGVPAALAGRETEAAAAGWLGLSGRLLTHAGAQGGINASTELANAIHEHVTGADPDALKSERLVPRLAQAGAMGAVLGAAFQIPGQVGDQIHAQQIASHAAMEHADNLGQAVELVQAAKVAQYSPGRLAQLLKRLMPDEARTTHFQTEDWEGVAKDAGMKPEDLAEAMHVEEQYRLAKATGQSMAVPTADMVQAAAGMENPKAITALLTHARKTPEGINAQEALTFYKEKPAEIDAQIAAMKQDLGTAAKSMSEADPIYQDFMGKAIGAGRPVDEAKQDARLMAAFFNTKAERWNAGTSERGATAIDPLAEYERYQLKVQTENPGAGIEVIDALLDRIRKGDIPKEDGIVGYHGSKSAEPLDFWDRSKIQSVGGFWFGDSKEKAGAFGTPHAYRLDIKNPADEHRLADARRQAAAEGFDVQTDAPAANERVQEILKDEGFDGVVFKNFKGAGSDKTAYVAFDDEQIQPHEADRVREGLLNLKQHLKSKGIDIARPNAEIKALLAGDELPAIATFEQPTRGSISYNAERHFLITLTGKANLSTVLHESGHFFLEVMGDYAEREGAPEQFKTDYAEMLKFLGVEKRGDIGTPQHEKWARAVEQYLMEGHAPSPELRGVFQRFALWLGHLYSKLKELVTLTPEVRRVFDRMLASDEAINRAKEDLGTSTIFKDQESSGMNPREWQAYLRDIQTERERSYANVFNKAMATLRHENTKTYRREKAGALEEAAAIVNARPVHVAEDIFVHGIGADGKDLPEKPKLDRAEIERDYGKGTVHKLPQGITAEDGMSLQMAADLVGFKTGEELWGALANMPDRKAEIKKLADGIMQARNPDLTPEVMLSKAMEAVHANSAHADVLGRESAALAIKAGRRKIPQEQIKGIAEALVADTNHRDLNPNIHLRAQRKASKESADAFLAQPPDYTAALLAKQREELAHAMFRATQEAKEVVDKTVALMKDAARGKTQEMLGKAGGQGWTVVAPDGTVTPFLEPIAAADYAKATGGVAQQGEGYLTAMNKLLEFWQQDRLGLDYGQVHDFYNSARAIMHQAREASSILVEGKREKLETEVAAGLRTESEAKKTVVVQPRSLGPLDKAGRLVLQVDAFLRTLSAVTRQMDGEKDGGWHWQNFTRRLNEASDHEQVRKVANAEVYQRLVKEWGKSNIYKKEFIPAIGDRLSLESRIAVGLNVGSSKNVRRLMDGEGWTPEQIKAITDTLDPKDWAFIKGVWDHTNGQWPEIRAMKQRLDGVPPEKRDSLMIETPHGTIQGQYYPIVYDPNLTAKAMNISLEKQRMPIFGKPGSGFTEKTAEHTDLRLLLDLSTINRHWNDVAHYLSHAEAITDMNKLLGNKALSQGMIDRFGIESYKVIRDTVQDVARGMQGPQNMAERVVKFLRQRSGMATMGFNAMSAASQGFGMTQSMERVGAAAYMRAVGKIMQGAGSAESASAWARGKSKMMEHRASGLLLEQVEEMNGTGAGSIPAWFRRHAYDLMNRAQWMVDLPTWMAGYENALKDHPLDDAKAVALADQAVLDTQGSGFTKDLSKAQRANEFTKVLMQFGGFFNKTYNLGRNRIAAETHGKTIGGVTIPVPNDAESAARMAGSFLLLVSLPAVAMSAFKAALRPSQDNDGSAGYWAKRLGKDQLGYLLNTMIFGRELSGALDGFDYSGPSGMRSFGVLSSLIKQAGQGKADHGLGKAALATTGLFWGIPSNQIQKTIDGIMYDSEHGSLDPRAPLFGPPTRR